MDWCLDHDLAVIASSDAHWPIDQMVDRGRGERRDMTLVLAGSRGETSIREAIKARRTLAYFGEMIWGREEWLRALAESLLRFSVTPSIQENRKRHFLSVANSSSFPFRMKVSRAGEESAAGLREVRIAERGRTVAPVSVKEGRRTSGWSSPSPTFFPARTGRWSWNGYCRFREDHHEFCVPRPAHRRSCGTPVCVCPSRRNARVPAQEGREVWRESSFADFADGTLTDGGANTYVGADGSVRLINELDLNQDGLIDLVLPGSHDNNFDMDAWVYWGRDDFAESAAGPRSRGRGARTWRLRTSIGTAIRTWWWPRVPTEPGPRTGRPSIGEANPASMSSGGPISRLFRHRPWPREI